jgi:hypothetical protein
MRVFGELKGRSKTKQTVKSPIITIEDQLSIELEYNDVPVTVFYKYANYPWQSMLINNEFKALKIPRKSDIYLSCSLANDERVVYDVSY